MREAALQAGGVGGFSLETVVTDEAPFCLSLAVSCTRKHPMFCSQQQISRCKDDITGQVLITGLMSCLHASGACAGGSVARGQPGDHWLREAGARPSTPGELVKLSFPADVLVLRRLRRCGMTSIHHRHIYDDISRCLQMAHSGEDKWRR